MPSIPWSRHSCASSRVSMPLMINLPFQDLRMRSTKFQSVEGSEVRTPFMSIPSYMRLAYRTSEDRTVINSAKQIYVHIDLGGVAQASRTQLDVFKSIA